MQAMQTMQTMQTMQAMQTIAVLRDGFHKVMGCGPKKAVYAGNRADHRGICLF